MTTHIGEPLAPQRPVQPPLPLEKINQRNIGSYLLTLLDSIRESSAFAYEHIEQHSGLERLILLQLGPEPKSFLEIQTALGHDKAQISRALSKLEESKLVSRLQLRSPFELTRLGRKLYEAIKKVVIRRTGELITDIEAKDVAWFNEALDFLLTNANRMNAKDNPAENADANDVFRSRGNPTADPIDIIPKLYSLLYLIKQYSLSICKQELSVTNFESILIICIKHAQPTTVSFLAQYNRRDKGQVGRAITALCKTGLLIRSEQPHTKRKGIYLTEKGNEVYRKQQIIAAQTDSMLMEGFGPTQEARFRSLLQQLNENALQMRIKASADN